MGSSQITTPGIKNKNHRFQGENAVSAFLMQQNVNFRKNKMFLMHLERWKDTKVK